jgi:hypothetical protein
MINENLVISIQKVLSSRVKLVIYDILHNILKVPETNLEISIDPYDRVKLFELENIESRTENKE